jgi:hypothetical protein
MMESVRVAVVATLLSALSLPSPAASQTLHGRVVESGNGRPVALAGVYLLNRDREAITLAIADSLGRYQLTVPDSAEYFLLTQRLGYFEVESPLLVISGRRDYELDFELRPEPIALDPLTVTVRNDDFTRWWALEFGGNPQNIPGFRLIQGALLEEAKMRAEDNTETLRFVYVSVTHGLQVCIAMTPRAVRGGYNRPPKPGPGAAPESCGRLYVDDQWIPNEHIEDIDMAKIGVIATFPGVVRMYSRDFDWTFRAR